VHAPSCIFAEIGGEQTSSNPVAGIRHDRERDNRQYRLQQHQIVFAKALPPIGREGIADPGAARHFPSIAEADEPGEIIGGAGGGEILEHWKIELRFGPYQPPAEMQQRPSLDDLFVRLALEMAEDAGLHILLVPVAARELRRPLKPTVAPPRVGITAPLRMQCAHPREGAPQRHTGDDEALTETVEQRSGLGAAKSFANRPDMQFDDFSTERVVEAVRQRRQRRRTCTLGHGPTPVHISWCSRP